MIKGYLRFILKKFYCLEGPLKLHVQLLHSDLKQNDENLNVTDDKEIEWHVITPPMSKI